MHTDPTNGLEAATGAASASEPTQIKVIFVEHRPPRLVEQIVARSTFKIEINLHRCVYAIGLILLAILFHYR